MTVNQMTQEEVCKTFIRRAADVKEGFAREVDLAVKRVGDSLTKNDEGRINFYAHTLVDGYGEWFLKESSPEKKRMT